MVSAAKRVGADLLDFSASKMKKLLFVEYTLKQ